MSMEPRSHGIASLVAIATVVPLAVLSANALWSWAMCGGDNSGCAMGGRLVRYEGRVFTPDGRPANRARVEYSFESHRGRPIRVATDAHGRFCFAWPDERISPQIDVRSARSTAPADPRFAKAPRDVFDPHQVNGYPIVLDPFYGSYYPRSTTNVLTRRQSIWHARTDTATTCPRSRVQPSWKRVDGAGHNWRVVTINWISAVALALAVVALAIRRWRLGLSSLTARAAVGFALLAATAWVLVWIVDAF